MLMKSTGPLANAIVIENADHKPIRAKIGVNEIVF